METATLSTRPFTEVKFKRPYLIAGPCSAETEEQVLATAAQMKEQGIEPDLFRAGIWKPRTRPGSFEGIGRPATQLRGVQPDIRFPTLSEADSRGESSFDNALPWAQVKAADYSPVGDFNSLQPLLQARHEARIKSDKDFMFLQEDIAEVKLRRKKNLISLNEAERRKERDAQEARCRLEARKKADKSAQEGVAGQESASETSTARRDDGLQADERTLASELKIEKARKDAMDVFLNEANIVQYLIFFSIGGGILIYF